MPQDRGDPSALAWLIGNELKNARVRAKFSQKAAGAVVGLSHASISYMESGSPQDPLKVEALLEAYGCDSAYVDRLKSLAGSYATKGTWWADFKDVVEDWFATFFGLEALAKSEFVWEPDVIPGMLQVPEYHEALLVNHLRVAPAEVPQIIKLRRARQERLREASEPLIYITVIEEKTLDRLVGGPQVMRQQLAQLLQWNKLPNVELFVMPSTTAVHDGLDGEFTLLDFDVAQSIGYIEFADGAVLIQDHDRVHKYDLARQRMCAAATASVEEAITSRLDRLAAA